MLTKQETENSGFVGNLSNILLNKTWEGIFENTYRLEIVNQRCYLFLFSGVDFCKRLTKGKFFLHSGKITIFEYFDRTLSLIGIASWF